MILLDRLADMVELPPSMFPQQTSNKPVKVQLNSADPVFAELRDMILSKVGAYLSRKAKSLSSEYDGTSQHDAFVLLIMCAFSERHEAKTVSQIKQFTSKLKRMKVRFCEILLQDLFYSMHFQDEQMSIKMQTDIGTELGEIVKSPKFHNNFGVEQVQLSLVFR